MITMTSATRAGRGLPEPGAFPRAGAWPAAGLNRSDAASVAGRPMVGATRLPGNAAAQPSAVYTDKTRKDAGMRAMGSLPRRAPV